MIAEEIRAEIDRVCRRDWEIELAPLLARLRQLDPTTVFYALFQFAAHSQTSGPAAPAALLLWQLNPPCPLSCQQALQELLVDWDVSIEEVPFYLARQFGVAQVTAAVAELRHSHPDHPQSATFKVIEFWLSGYEHIQASEAEHRMA